MKALARNWLVLVSIAAIILSFTRLFFGIDFTDESQYVAQALGPVLGGQPFLTDRYFQQTGSLVATPLVWLYVQLVGSTTGLVLFYRILFFLFGAVTSLTLYKSLRSNHRPQIAFALASLPMLYIPFAIPSVSYNTLAVLFTIMSLALWRISIGAQSSFAKWILPVTMALAVFCYPPLVLAFSLIFRKELMAQFAWAAALIILLTTWVTTIGLDELSLNFALARKGSLLPLATKIELSLNYLKMLLPSIFVLAAICVSAGGLYYLKRSFAFSALPILAAFYIYIHDRLPFEITFGFFIFGVVITILLAIFDRSVGLYSLMKNPALLVSLVVGLIMGSTSGNGILNAALGLFIAMLFLIEGKARAAKRLPIGAWLSVVCICVISPWLFFYREASLKHLTYRVTAGPFAGLITNSLKADFINSLQTDLSSLPESVQSIFVYDSLPAGYLMTSLRPVTFFYYMHPAFLTPALRPELIKFFAEQGHRPDVVLETYSIPVTENGYIFAATPEQNKYNDPFWGFFRTHPEYMLHLQRPNYAIYLRGYR